jgi:flagellar hook-associated protein 3 FlgL
MRISTSQMYQMSVSQMDDQQAQLAQLNQEISSGVSLQTAADNPLGAAQAVRLSMTAATMTQYTSNQSSALSSLQAEDQTLSSVNNVLSSIHALAIEAGDGSLSDTNRSALAAQMQSYRSQLLTLANSTDSSGNYLFAGYQSASAPFADKAGGGVTYSGDSGVRQVQISDTRAVAQNDNGASVFLSVPLLGSQPVPAGGAGNTGTGTIGAVTITNPSAATNAHQFTITFGGTAAAPTYTVTDNTVAPPTTTAAQAYQTGTAIALGGGETVAVSGSPAPGDTFTVTPAPQAGTDVFQTLDTMIAALQQPVSGNAAAGAALQNAMTAGSTQLNNAMTNVVTVQASVGGREQEVKAMQTVTSTNSLQVSSSLSSLTSTDMASTISQYLQTQNALTGAQKAFVETENLSLFQYVNPS